MMKLIKDLFKENFDMFEEFVDCISEVLNCFIIIEDVNYCLLVYSIYDERMD